MANYVYELIGKTFQYGRNRKNLKTQALQNGGDGAVSTVVGQPVGRDGFIKSVAVETRDACDASFQVINNKTEAVLYTLSLSSEKGKSADNLYVAVTADMDLGVWMVVNSGRVHFPVCLVEII